jgi:probable DNA metabolism protein
MIYTFNDNVNDILKAGFLYYHTNNLPLYYKEKENNLFAYETTPVSDIPWADILALNKSFPHKKKELLREEFLKIIFFNLRFNKDDKYKVILEGIRESLTFPLKVWLKEVTDVSKILIKRKRIVTREIHKMVGFIRFVPIEKDFLIGTALLEHYTADLILINLRKRYPGYTLGLLWSDKGLVLNKDNSFSEIDRKEYFEKIANDQFHRIWKEYYTCQYIAERKNIKYLQRNIPKKYSSIPNGMEN